MKSYSLFYKKTKAFDVSVIESKKYYNKTEVAKMLGLSIISINRHFEWSPIEQSKHKRKYILGRELIRFINQHKEKELSSERIAKYREQLSNSGYVSKAFETLSDYLSKGIV